MKVRESRFIKQNRASPSPTQTRKKDQTSVLPASIFSMAGLFAREVCSPACVCACFDRGSGLAVCFSPVKSARRASAHGLAFLHWSSLLLSLSYPCTIWAKHISKLYALRARPWSVAWCSRPCRASVIPTGPRASEQSWSFRPPNAKLLRFRVGAGGAWSPQIPHKRLPAYITVRERQASL